MDTGGTKGDGEGQNSRKECDRRAENGREQTETDRDGRRMFENKFYVTYCRFTVFHHQTCFPMTDSRFHCRFTVFHHKTRFPTTNTRLQPFSFTCDSFHRQILFYSCFSHFQRQTLVYSHFHPPTSLSNNKHSFTAIFHYHTCFPTTKILLQLFSSTNLPFHRQILFYSCFPPPYMHFHHLSIKQRTVIFTLLLLKRRTDAEAECMEDGRNGWIGATEYAEGNRTRKRGGDAEHITQG